MTEHSNQSQSSSTPAAAASARPRARRVWQKILLAAAALLALVLVIAYLFPRQLLTIETGPVQADVIVLLGGGSGDRPQRAAELFHAGAAPRIIVSGEMDAADNKRLLVNRGVPPEVIELEPNSKSTRQNAQFTIPRLRVEGARRVIIVTSWYHSRRALKCFRHYGPDLEFFSHPAYYAAARSQWRPARVSHFIRSEYVKLIGYWACYGVCPL